MPHRTDEFENDLTVMGYEDEQLQSNFLDMAIKDNAIFSFVREHDDEGFRNYIFDEDNYDPDSETNDEIVIPDIFGAGEREFSMASSTISSKFIMEFENDNIYIPSSSYCGVKSVNKYFEYFTGKSNVLTYKSLSPYRVKKSELIKHINKYFIKCECNEIAGYKQCSNECIRNKVKLYNNSNIIERLKWFKENNVLNNKYILPPTFCKVYIENKEVKIVNISKKDNNSIQNNTCIGLLNVPGCKKVYHAVLIKNKNSITVKDLKLTLSDRFVLHPECYRLPKFFQKDYNSICCAYDIETFVIPKNSYKLDLYPSALGFQIFNIDTGEMYDKYNMICKIKENAVKLDTKSIYIEFFKYLHQFCITNNFLKMAVFAHNGGKFDNLYAFDLPGIEYKSIIRVGNNIKKMSLLMGEVEITLLDTLPFTLSSLKMSCKMFKTDIKKQTFDIVNKPRCWYQLHYSDNSFNKYRNNSEFMRIYNDTMSIISQITDNKLNLDCDERRDWVKYLEYDVLSLSNLIINVQKMYKDLGFSITNHVGLPGVAWDIMNSYCYGLRNTYIPKDPTIIKFYKKAYYGGRTIFFHKKWDSPVIDGNYSDYLICIDMNSLYPSVMQAMGYPVGEPKLIKENNDDWINYPHYVVDVDIEIPNIRYAIHPVRLEGVLVYPSNMIIRGIYNDVDLREMMKDGYKVKKLHQGVYFNKSSKIYHELIGMIYDLRTYYKKLGKDHPEFNKEYICKILLNSTYGKYSETIYHTTKYMTEDKYIKKMKKKYSKIGLEYNTLELINKHTRKVSVISLKLANGKYYVKERLDNPIVKKPSYIAGYVTAYSRALMNEIIRKIGAENIYASDTDSLYIKYSILKEHELKTSGDLCGFKNDYGDNVMITKARFLDIKRAYLEFDVKTKIGDKHPITRKKCDKVESCKTFKFKFSGLNFKDVKSVSNIIHPVDISSGMYNKKTELEYYGLMKTCENMAEKLMLDSENYNNSTDENKIKDPIKFVLTSLKKHSLGVIVDNHEMQFNIAPEKRGQWINNQYFALGFDTEKEEFISKNYYPIGYLKEQFKNLDNVNYSITSNKLIRSNRPLFFPTNIKYKFLSEETSEDYMKICNQVYENIKNKKEDKKLINKINSTLISVIKQYHKNSKDVINAIQYLENSVAMFDKSKTYDSEYYIDISDTKPFYHDIKGFIHHSDIDKINIYFKEVVIKKDTDISIYYIPGRVNMDRKIHITNTDNLYPLVMLSDKFNDKYGRNNISISDAIHIFKNITK